LLSSCLIRPSSSSLLTSQALALVQTEHHSSAFYIYCALQWLVLLGLVMLT
jgi:hypothetical protein